jgi:hypothetical protein
VALAAHVQEPGACDNASGVATQLEALRALCSGIDSGRIERPAQSLCFVWGLEMRQSSVLLEKGGKRIVAAVVGDMTGESRRRRAPSRCSSARPIPGSLKALPPDVHTEWGSSVVDPKDQDSSGIALVARLALHDSALAAGGWETKEHPFEGGSEPQFFLRRDPGRALLALHRLHYHTASTAWRWWTRPRMRRMGTA